MYIKGCCGIGCTDGFYSNLYKGLGVKVFRNKYADPTQPYCIFTVLKPRVG